MKQEDSGGKLGSNNPTVDENWIYVGWKLDQRPEAIINKDQDCNYHLRSNL